MLRILREEFCENPVFINLKISLINYIFILGDGQLLNLSHHLKLSFYPYTIILLISYYDLLNIIFQMLSPLNIANAIKYLKTLHTPYDVHLFFAKKKEEMRKIILPIKI